MRALEELVGTLRFLRGEHGCSWDRKQTLADLCRHLLDEAYELQDTTDLQHPAETAEEIGDVLFLALSCALFVGEHGGPDLEAIATGAKDKIVRRHPHVFADRSARSPEEVEHHWRDMKEKEARERGEHPPALLDRLPRSLPAIRRALTVQRKVAQVGFEWETAQQVHAKLLEEARELQDVLPLQDPSRIQEELGDMLFSVVNLGRFLDVDPETALHTTIEKFRTRFTYVEKELEKRGQTLQQATLQEMDALWEESKQRETRRTPPGAEG